MRREIILSLASLIVQATSALATPPRPAPPVYKTPNYALTFQAPTNTTYCPLPEGWTGSDHGTTLFLTPPADCANDAGYASSGRFFKPGNTPRIDIYYGYYSADDTPSTLNHCLHPAGQVYVLGQHHPLCFVHRDGLIGYEVTGLYRIEHANEAEAIFTLLTTRARLSNDRRIFRRLLARVRSCAETWSDSDHRHHSHGAGCPANAAWF